MNTNRGVDHFRRGHTIAFIVLLLFAGLFPSKAVPFASSASSNYPYRVLLPLATRDAIVPPPLLPYRLVPEAHVCFPNAGVSFYTGIVQSRNGAPKNDVCVHLAFYGPRITKCTGCDGVGAGRWGFAPFGGPAPADVAVEIFIVTCPEHIPPGGQVSGFGDLTPLSDKWVYTTTTTSIQCNNITFVEN